MSASGKTRTSRNGPPTDVEACQGGIFPLGGHAGQVVGPLPRLIVGEQGEGSDLAGPVAVLAVLLEDPADLAMIGRLLGRGVRADRHGQGGGDQADPGARVSLHDGFDPLRRGPNGSGERNPGAEFTRNVQPGSGQDFRPGAIMRWFTTERKDRTLENREMSPNRSDSR